MWPFRPKEDPILAKLREREAIRSRNTTRPWWVRGRVTQEDIIRDRELVEEAAQIRRRQELAERNSVGAPWLRNRPGCR